MNPIEKTPDTHNDESVPEQDTARSSENPKAPFPGSDYPVVGLGASAGGVQALQDFFKAMPGVLTVLARHPYLLSETGADEKADDGGPEPEADHEK